MNELELFTISLKVDEDGEGTIGLKINGALEEQLGLSIEYLESKLNQKNIIAGAVDFIEAVREFAGC